MSPKLLTKTRYLNGLQCPKYLWISLHEPGRIPEPDAGTLYRFDQGRLVGQLAQKLFPGGVEIPVDDFGNNMRQTIKLLNERKPLFEAGIRSRNLYCRVDIFRPAGSDSWDIIEVKSSTGIKEVDLHDVSFQRFCCEQGGTDVDKCYLMHINNQYVRDGEIDCEQLFMVENITQEVREITRGIRSSIDDLLEVVRAERCPEADIGRHCDYPYSCPLKYECWSFLPEHNVFELYYGGAKCTDLYNSGIIFIKNIPEHFRLSEKQKIQRECVTRGIPFIDRERLREFLDTLRYPLWFLDFETFSPAVPMFDDTRPYQKIPFQFSIHVVRGNNKVPEHISFLAEGTGDPRPALLSKLRKSIGDQGSIVAYNAAFEKSVLLELGNTFPEHQEWVENLQYRFVDLLTPFRNFHYYQSDQKGSASMKSVLPSLTGIGYEGMDISDGQEASIAFVSMMYADTSYEERTRVRKYLEEYCGLDTWGMTRIVEKLRESL